MYYDTVQFGNSIKRIRQNLKLTQKAVVELTGINDNTIRRLENGKVLPKQETLDLLSVVYKCDLSQVFLSCRMKDFEKYNALMEEVDKAFEASDTVWLSQCLETLLLMSKSEMNDYYKRLLKQTIYLVRGVIHLLDEDNCIEAHDLIMNGLKITITDFNYQNYRDHNYTKLELQLLMNLSSIEQELNNLALSKNLAEYCVEILDENPELKKGYLPTKIFLNASYMNHFSKNHLNALEYANRGIAYNNLMRSQYAIGHLYARKGFAEHNLGFDKEMYLPSFKKAYFYHDVLEQNDLKNLLVRILKERKGIDLLKEL